VQTTLISVGCNAVARIRYSDATVQDVCVKDVVKDTELHVMVSFVRVVTSSDRVVVIFLWCTRVPYTSNMPARTPLGSALAVLVAQHVDLNLNDGEGNETFRCQEQSRTTYVRWEARQRTMFVRQSR